MFASNLQFPSGFRGPERSAKPKDALASRLRDGHLRVISCGVRKLNCVHGPVSKRFPIAFEAKDRLSPIFLIGLCGDLITLGSTRRELSQRDLNTVICADDRERSWLPFGVLIGGRIWHNHFAKKRKPTRWINRVKLQLE